MKRKFILGILVLAMLMLPMAAACSSTSTSTSAAAPNTAASTNVAPSNTLKVGVAVWMGWPLGLDMKRGIDVMADMDNAAGGIDIGGQKYKIQFIEYDTQNDQNTTMADINKLIYQDKVNYIITDSMYIGSVVPVTEKNKVICMCGVPVPAQFDPSYNYTFEAGFMDFATPEVVGWLAKNTNMKVVDAAFPDDQGGHSYANGNVPVFEAAGIKVNEEFYPPTSTDLSALGTKVKNDNPDGFMAAGGSGTDALAYQAVVQAGYKGQLFSPVTITTATLETAVPAAGLEGFLGGAWPTEFDPAVTPIAKAFKAAYIAKYGKWDGPEIQLTGAWVALKAALEKAGTTDTTKVADVLGNGLQFEGPTGKGEMVPRYDLGISKTVDSITEVCIKKIVNGQPTLLHTVTLDEGKSYLPPGVLTPTSK